MNGWPSRRLTACTACAGPLWGTGRGFRILDGGEDMDSVGSCVFGRRSGPPPLMVVAWTMLFALAPGFACSDKKVEDPSAKASAPAEWKALGEAEKALPATEAQPFEPAPPGGEEKPAPVEKPAVEEQPVVAEKPVPEVEQAEVEAGKPVPPKAEEAPLTEPAPPERAEPPVETVLKPGTLLVYSFGGFFENDQEGLQFGKGFLKCELKEAEKPADRVAFSVACSEVPRVSMAGMDPVWSTNGVYFWGPDGLWYSFSTDKPALEEGGPVVPVEPGKWEFVKPLDKLSGYPSKAHCFETPESDEPGDEQGEVKCLTPALGTVLWQPWRFGGWGEEEDFRLVEAVTDRKVLQDPARKDSEARARELLQRWLDAQNRGDNDAYAALYAPKLGGVKRAGRKTTTYDRDGWLEDRGRMFKRPMKVAAEEVEVYAEAHRVTVLFYQHWSSGKYADWGPKLMVVSTAATPAIVYEEMMWSKRK